ncbi:hypothetical protein GGR56DRAFT_696464 [Xylariaceae sp. FL0804]|nr:hypothetical protein GGR56DRAFT_696464 [Xylariaceae sp. FL0804]
MNTTHGNSTSRGTAELSCPSHPYPPAYTLGANEQRLSLVPQNYKARDLFNCTVGSFFEVPDDQLTHRQLTATDELVRSYEYHAGRRLSDLHRDYLGLHRILRGFMKQLDELFFFGSLTDSGCEASLSLVLYTQSGVGLAVGEGARGLAACSMLAGRCLRTYDQGRPRPWIEIALTRQGRPPPALGELLCTLLHAMVHAFLFAYCCPSGPCRLNRVNAWGLPGHGPTFRGLHLAALHHLQTRCGGGGGRRRSTSLARAVADELDHIRMCRQRGDFAVSRSHVAAPAASQLNRVAQDSVEIDSVRGNNSTSSSSTSRSGGVRAGRSPPATTTATP